MVKKKIKKSEETVPIDIKYISDCIEILAYNTQQNNCDIIINILEKLGSSALVVNDESFGITVKDKFHRLYLLNEFEKLKIRTITENEQEVYSMLNYPITPTNKSKLSYIG